MGSLNKVLLMGNLCADPEIRTTASGTPVGKLRLAVNRSYGEDKKETLFVDVTVWAKQAELCEKYLSKGRQVLVEGRLKLEQWETDGQKRSRVVVVAENIQFLGGNGGSVKEKDVDSDDGASF